MFNNKTVLLGQSQIIKIMRSNKQPLTQESMRAIVKEVTGYDSTNVKVSLKFFFTIKLLIEHKSTPQ